MFTKNDTAGRYVNGTRCIVMAFEKSPDAWPIVKTYDNKMITAYPEEWTYEENGVVRASLSQVPLRLAWAITIHKSQGMTLDAAEIDLGDAFEPGMGYVALSRVRSLDGLKLMNLNEIALKVNTKILAQDNIFKKDSAATIAYLQSLSEEEKIESYKKTLIERFAAENKKIVRNKDKRLAKTRDKDKKTTADSRKDKAIPTHLATLELLKEKFAITSIAEKRGVTMGTILGHLEKLKGLKILDHAMIKHLIEAIPKEEFDLIFSELNKSQDGKLKSIYEKFDGKYAYTTIQLIRLFC